MHKVVIHPKTVTIVMMSAAQEQKKKCYPPVVDEVSMEMHFPDSQGIAVQCAPSHGLECTEFDISKQGGDG